MNAEKACTRFLMNSGPELGFGHKIDKVFKFGDDFELQLGMRKHTVQKVPYHRLLMLSNEP